MKTNPLGLLVGMAILTCVVSAQSHSARPRSSACGYMQIAVVRAEISPTVPTINSGIA